jgi:hypothetical protein
VPDDWASSKPAMSKAAERLLHKPDLPALALWGGANGFEPGPIIGKVEFRGLESFYTKQREAPYSPTVAESPPEAGGDQSAPERLGSSTWQARTCAEVAALYRTKQAYAEQRESQDRTEVPSPRGYQGGGRHGVRARRSRFGAVSFDLLEMESGHAPVQ